MNADRPAAGCLCSGDADCFCAVCREGGTPGHSSLDSSSETSRHETLTLFCAKCGHKHVVKLRCGDRTCAVCREKDFWRMFKGYLESVEAIKRPKLLTLTLRNVPELKREHIRGLRKSFTKLMHRKWYKDRVRGGLQTIEIVNKGNGWHVHMHVLLDAEYLPQRKIAKDWQEITGDSFMVDIREAGTVKEGLKYCLKYLSKAPVLSGHEEEYREAVKGLRLVQPFGTLYGELVMRLPSLPCPDCGSVEWIVWEFELGPEFRRFVDGKGAG
jgi:DNA-directed RNA polymerase subunit RPC12/RpoP